MFNFFKKKSVECFVLGVKEVTLDYKGSTVITYEYCIFPETEIECKEKEGWIVARYGSLDVIKYIRAGKMRDDAWDLENVQKFQIDDKIFKNDIHTIAKSIRKKMNLPTTGDVK